MAGKGQSLEVTPTWAVAVVCFVLVAISIIIERIIHWIGKWLTKNHKGALNEALEKIKSELMLLGFISLLLTVLQGTISEICISKALGATWHPCDKRQEEKKYRKDKEKLESSGRRGLLTFQDYSENHGRVLAAVGYDKCAEKGKVPFVSAYGIHQLHIFIFVLALFHVLYCIVTLALGQVKMRKWEAWEIETRTTEYQAAHDPERFRLTRDTSFGRRHLSFWSRSPILLWIVCFFRQFVRSIHKVDYLTLRYGFINAHLEPRSQSNFNFLNYIKKSLEEDFKVVVEISPLIWLFAVVFLLFNTHGWHSYLWFPFIPLIIILLVGTKLQVIITKMGVRIQERGEVVKGTPVVQLGDDLFWFNHPQLLLYVIHFVLFQNAFQLAFFAWTWYAFGLRTCFHAKTDDIVIRISLGILVQIICSYVTLPLYALVTQMGSTMKPTIFNEEVAKALKSWYRTAHKQVKESSHAGSARSSYPTTPTHVTTPVHLLRYYRNEIDSVHTPPRKSNCDTRPWKTEGPGPSTAPPYPDKPRSYDQVGPERKGPKQNIDDQPSQSHLFQHEIQLTDFSLDKSSRV